ncbi:MAG: sigma-54 dependent transcriptional regulator [Desulfobacterales bacterium]|nr:sigma-54 dependent transcriptional regulator [Pseudomonadota bacterium]MBU4355586.1 sigma-54 dependent transcriptional regulator [Pseudomonadota bacterium]MCG2773783.1 sigma-54 dependent transcriptional regulator [Desulfobacterales bacterium]
MPEAPAHILVIDDDKAMRDACFQILSRQGYRVELAAGAKQGLSLLERLSFDTILLDLVMPDMDGLEALKKIRALDPDVEVIIITGYGTIQSAVESIKAGAFHFLSKPFVPDDLRNLVSRALGKRRLDLENLYLRQELKIKDERNTLVYESESMIRIMDMIARVAPTDSTVLITGESGTGKGLVARKLHQLSQRSRRPFITVDCGTLVETLFESELFGHVKGSFTGADANKIGKFELAQNGTLFFDEISNIGLEVQAKLLRAVEERKISKVGNHRVITVDVRIIAATNKDLTKAIKDGTFREDLFYRLNVVLIQMPPLRDRKSDIPLLVEHFLEKYNTRLRKEMRGISSDALDLLVRHDWPGNVRELENTMERLLVLSPGPYLEPADLVFAGTILTPAGEAPDGTLLKDLERNHIIQTLQRCDGHKSETARALGIDRKTLREKLKRYDLE